MDITFRKDVKVTMKPNCPHCLSVNVYEMRFEDRNKSKWIPVTYTDVICHACGEKFIFQVMTFSYTNEDFFKAHEAGIENGRVVAKKLDRHPLQGDIIPEEE